ncbi:hypothetical protein CHS0354_012963, partial [Potamilus streckersoni]
MNKIVLLVGFLGLCLAFPYLQVSAASVTISSEIKQAARLAVEEDFNNEKGCRNAKLDLIAYVIHE